jgi:hypothetical protein
MEVDSLVVSCPVGIFEIIVSATDGSAVGVLLIDRLVGTLEAEGKSPIGRDVSDLDGTSEAPLRDDGFNVGSPNPIGALDNCNIGTWDDIPRGLRDTSKTGSPDSNRVGLPEGTPEGTSLGSLSDGIVLGNTANVGLPENVADGQLDETVVGI